MKIPFLIAGPRSVTAVFAQICFYEVTLAIDLAGLSQIHLPATDPSCAATSSASTLISVGCQHALPSYTKIHSAALAAPPPDISRGFLPWRLSDAGLGPSRSAAIGRHPKPSTPAEATTPTRKSESKARDIRRYLLPSGDQIPKSCAKDALADSPHGVCRPSAMSSRVTGSGLVILSICLLVGRLRFRVA